MSSQRINLKLVSVDEMRQLDRRASEEFGISPLILMEHAGTGVADLAEKNFKSKSILVVAGRGNNGGDGFVAARHLVNRGYDVKVFLSDAESEIKGEAAANLHCLKAMKVPLTCDITRIESLISETGLIIDALFGVGLNRGIEGKYLDIVDAVNQSRRNVLSIDIPSGLNGDSGHIMGVCVKAAATAALGLPKQGLYARQGPLMAGHIYVVDIGLPRILTLH